MNESVLTMIDKLHARLDDLAEVVRDVPFELNGYDKKLDKIDDRVYLIEVELEKKLNNSIPLKPVSDPESKAFDSAAKKAEKSTSSTNVLKNAEASSSTAAEIDDDEEEETEGFLSDSAKETLAGATRTLNSIYKDSKEVFGEFGEAFSDIKDTFGVKGFFKKR